MFGQTRRRRIVEPQQLAVLGPIRIDTENADEVIAVIAEEQERLGGLAQIRLESEGERIVAVLRYATYKVAIGRLPNHVVTDALHAEIARLRRSGFTPACAADIIADGQGGHQVWLNHPEFDSALAAINAWALQDR